MRARDHLFFLSLLLTRLGDQVLLFLVPLVVFQTTQSVAWSGAAFFVETLPRFLSFPVCGILCDRVSPIRLLRLSQAYRALACVLGIAGHEALGGIGWLIALSAVCGVLTTQGQIAREVMLPQVFRHLPIQKVLSYSQLGDQLGVVLGPMAAATLLGWWPWQIVVVAAGILFLVADAAMALWWRAGRIALAEPESGAGHWVLPLKTALGHIRNLPGLKRVIALAMGVNLVIGVTLATSAAMVTGVHGQSEGYYAVLQTAGAGATILILFVIARTAIPLRILGALSYTAIFLGGLATGLSTSHWGYFAGFLLVVGFDKMFNIYIRGTRMQIIPSRDLGKTTGIIILLNNSTQPVAGLLVGLFAGMAEVGLVIAGLSLCMGLLGAVAAVAGSVPARKRA